MYQPRVFCVKLQLHFGGDVHEISVPAYDGAEPTVADLMNVVERDFRVARALQNLVFHGQELHPHPQQPLSRFGIRNLAPVRLVGRMAPPDVIQQINAQYNVNSCQQSVPVTTSNTVAANYPSYYEQFQYEQKPSIGTQYEPPVETPPPATPNRDQLPPPPTPNKGQLSERSNASENPPATPNSTATK